MARNQFLSAFPRYALEALGLVGIAFLGGLLVLQNGSGVAVIPLLGALALGAQRLLPAMQQVYRFWAALKGFNADLKGVLDMLNQPLPFEVCIREPWPFSESIILDSVRYRYGLDQQEVLKGINLEIRHGERIGLIGGTGSGKSTTVDLLMGLLKPTSGQLIVDGNNLHCPSRPELLVAWRAAIAHVPQSIYLADNSIMENIAFGVPKEQIDFSRVRKAADHAQLTSFINSCPEGFNTFVGERGVRLSGGQRQRIGIARALYKHARIIVFDEATSALDTSTEEAVIEALEGLSRELTVVMIAHRLSTLKSCDRIFRLENGRIEAQGSADHFLTSL